MNKKVLVLCSIFIFIFTLTSCKVKKTNDEINSVSKNVDNNKISVMVTFNPLKEFVESIGKDKVQVNTIIPDGVEAHDFEPKIKDLENLNRACLFVYNGLNMEPWVGKALSNLDNKNLEIVEATKGCNPIKSTDEKEIKEHGEYDPHTWLSLKEAKIESNNIKEALIKIDASNKEYFQKNYNEFVKQLDSLYNDYKVKFDKLSNKNFVTGHAAFGYLCRDFGLEQDSVEDVFAEGEPSAKKIQELVMYCKVNNIKTIFSEDNSSPEVSKTLANEVGGKVEKICTMEIKEQNKNYIQVMQENLDKIYNSLK